MTTPSIASPSKTQVVIVTGLSGAGKTTALHTLEDLGYFCVDNLPTVLAPQAVKVCEDGGMVRVALGIDVRVRAFLSTLGPVVSELADGSRELQILFLDASDEALLRRFSESRRPHPLATVDKRDAVAVLDGVRVERERLAPLRAQATRVFDTTHLSVHELRRAIIAQLGPASGGTPRMLTRFVSFGFKYGMPADADLVLDVRFLENPYFVPELKHLPGTDPKVIAFVLGLPEAQEFLAKTRDLLRFMMPKYEREGKSYLTIAIGCTGGRHRSVVLSDALAEALAGGAPRATADGSSMTAPPGSPATGTAPIVVLHRDVTRADRKGAKTAGAAPSSPSAAATAADDAVDSEDGPERFSTTELKGVLGGGRPWGGEGTS